MAAEPPQLPFEQTHPLQMSPTARALQRAAPIHKVHTQVGDEAWYVARYADVRRLLDDRRLGRTHPDPANAPRAGKSVLLGDAMGNFATEMSDHALMRSIAQPLFATKTMRAFRPRIEALATDLLDRLAEHDRPADLIAEFALPLPLQVICELLDVPYEDRDRFRAWVLDASGNEDPSRSRQGLTDLLQYSRALVARRRAEPGDDLISQVCAAAVDGFGDDKITKLVMALLFAGHETTMVAIGLGAVMLFWHRDQWEALHDDPGLIAGAVEEILRAPYKNRGGLLRYARADIEIGEVVIRAGELVLLDNRAANHDESVFSDSDRFDITRRDAPHVTFGHGPRYCLGAPLARIELQVVFSQLIQRFPEMRPAVPVEELMIRDLATGGLSELPVTW
ncbi:cytochrome P450 [Spirillospora sp. NBC_00431]